MEEAIMIRLSLQLKDELTTMANKKALSLSTYIRMILMEHVDRAREGKK